MCVAKLAARYLASWGWHCGWVQNHGYSAFASSYKTVNLSCSVPQMSIRYPRYSVISENSANSPNLCNRRSNSVHLRFRPNLFTRDIGVASLSVRGWQATLDQRCTPSASRQSCNSCSALPTQKVHLHSIDRAWRLLTTHPAAPGQRRAGDQKGPSKSHTLFHTQHTLGS